MKKLGAVPSRDGVQFHVWAPAQEQVFVVLENGREVPMDRDADGLFSADVADVAPGDRYWYRVREGLRADPASRFQPDGPSAASAVVDPCAFQWHHRDWPGAPEPHRHVLYELHLGTFTTEGTWRAAERFLSELADTGITTLEIMPVAEFSGRFGWGYDGVDLFAPSHLYGTPDDARHFVDAAHGAGLAVILDVVYNHFGPVGNYIRDFAPAFFGKPGDWGDSINFDGPGSGGVRRFIVENAVHWIVEYRFDGLRFDATQSINDSSAEHIISEAARAVRAAAGSRRLFLVGESEPQDTRLLRRSGVFPDGLDAIWNEDWHHAAYVALTGRRDAYFTDYLGTASEFAAMARHGLLYQGQWYSWQMNARGGSAFGLPGCSFVSFLENHDQVANTGIGGRLYETADPRKWRALTALLLLGPQLPMLFQGQEFASRRGFTYFADHEGDVGEAVRRGRVEFLSQFGAFQRNELRTQIPDPGGEQTVASVKISEEDRPGNESARRLHRDLLALRATDAVLSRVGSDEVAVESAAPTASIVLIRYVAPAGHRLLLVNLADDYQSPMNDPLFTPVPGRNWTSVWSSESVAYGGTGAHTFVGPGRWLIRGYSATLLALESGS